MRVLASIRRDGAEIWNRVGKDLYQAGLKGGALLSFERAVGWDPRRPCPAAWYNLGSCHERAGYLPGAIEAYSRYCALEPGDMAALSKLRALEQRKAAHDAEIEARVAAELAAEQARAAAGRAARAAQERAVWLARTSLQRLHTMSPGEFEDVVADLFRRIGFSVRQTPPVNDGGKDAVATKDGVRYCIECKRYAPNRPIGRPTLQRFYAAMHDEQAQSGYMVTTGRFAETARAYASKNGIELIDGPELARLMVQFAPGRNSGARP